MDEGKRKILDGMTPQQPQRNPMMESRPWHNDELVVVSLSMHGFKSLHLLFVSMKYGKSVLNSFKLFISSHHSSCPHHCRFSTFLISPGLLSIHNASVCFACCCAASLSCGIVAFAFAWLCSWLLSSSSWQCTLTLYYML